MKRRIFLQRISSLLAVLGVAESSWWTKGSRLQQALADTNRRKLALLVGINQYPQIPALKGCLTDVELQRELLIYRFGFQPSDIISLTDKEATREGIENTFLEHLVKQAKPGDVVVFHFSGYGSRIKTKSLLGGLKNTLIPVDGTQVIKDSEKVANYLLEDTLLLMMQSLATERSTAILDTSYYKPAIWQPTGMRLRCAKAPLEGQFLAEEIEFQKQLAKKIAVDKLSVLLASSSNSQDLAKEIIFSDFSAGLFTYALTQYLWETTAARTIQISLSRVGSSMLSLGNKQQPVFLEKNNQTKALTVDNFLSKNILGAQGAVTAIQDDGKTVDLWLGGIPPQVLEYYGVNSQFTFYSAASPSTAPLVLRSRNGLKAKATFKEAEDEITPKVGELVRESVRVLPKDINLKIALDDVSLERIERVDATSAFSSIERVSTVIVGEQPADYLFAKLPETEGNDTKANNLKAMSSSSRYGLFTLGGELIPDTVGEEGEALKIAVSRLAPKLKTLLAAKLWKLTQNEGSSGLSVKATLEIVDNNQKPRALMECQTRRALGMETSIKKTLDVSSPGIPTVSTGSKIHCRVENTGDRPLYLMLLGLNNSKNPIVLYPWYKDKDSKENSSKSELQQVIISPGETLIVPKTTTGFEWVISGTQPWCTQIILSTAPFTRTLKALDEGKHSTASTQSISPLLNPLEVAKELLEDLHQASIKKDETQNSSGDSWVWNVNNWASFNFIFQVV